MARHHAKPGEVVNLQPLGHRLADARSTAIIKAHRFEAIHLIVPAGSEIPPHDVAGNITLHCIEGRVALGLEQDKIELSAGEWVYLAGGEEHSVRGLENSSLLLTIIFDDEGEGSGTRDP